MFVREKLLDLQKEKVFDKQTLYSGEYSKGRLNKCTPQTPRPGYSATLPPSQQYRGCKDGETQFCHVAWTAYLGPTSDFLIFNIFKTRIKLLRSSGEIKLSNIFLFQRTTKTCQNFCFLASKLLFSSKNQG